MSSSTLGKIIALFFIISNVGCRNDSVDELYPVNGEAALPIYEGELQAIIEAKCISCHSNYHSTGDANYDTFDKTVARIDDIIGRVNSKTMPPVGDIEAPALTDAEIEVFNRFLAALSGDADNAGATDVEEVKAKPIHVNWTAYKYPDRFEGREGSGVGGTFEKVTYSLNNEALSNDNLNVFDLLDNASVSITTSSVNIDSLDGLRTINVSRFFNSFSETIVGTVTGYSDNSADVVFEMNGISRTTILDVEYSEENNQLILTGSIPDLAVYNWQEGYAVLDSLCGDVHENTLWPDIDLEAIINIDELKPVEVNWTAYKYPDRFEGREGSGVGGTFDDISYSFSEDATLLVNILNDATITINTSSVNIDGIDGLRTNNVGMFFEYFTQEIVGTVTRFTLLEADVMFEMNGISDTVSLSVEVLEDTDQIILSGSIPNLGVYNWFDAEERFENVCGELHENKLWPDVSIRAVINRSNL